MKTIHETKLQTENKPNTKSIKLIDNSVSDNGVIVTNERDTKPYKYFNITDGLSNIEKDIDNTKKDIMDKLKEMKQDASEDVSIILNRIKDLDKERDEKEAESLLNNFISNMSAQSTFFYGMTKAISTVFNYVAFLVYVFVAAWLTTEYRNVNGIFYGDTSGFVLILIAGFLLYSFITVGLRKALDNVYNTYAEILVGIVKNHTTNLGKVYDITINVEAQTEDMLNVFNNDKEEE